VVYVISVSDFVRRDEKGKVLFDSRQADSSQTEAQVAGQWLDPLPPHSVENVGHSEISLVIVELKTQN